MKDILIIILSIGHLIWLFLLWVAIKVVRRDEQQRKEKERK